MGQGLMNAKLGIEGTGVENSRVLGSSVLPKENPPNAKQDVDGCNPKEVKDDAHVN